MPLCSTTPSITTMPTDAMLFCVPPTTAPMISTIATIEISGKIGSTLRTALLNNWLTTRPTTIGSATICRMLISMPCTSTAIDAST